MSWLLILMPVLVAVKDQEEYASTTEARHIHIS